MFHIITHHFMPSCCHAIHRVVTIRRCRRRQHAARCRTVDDARTSCCISSERCSRRKSVVWHHYSQPSPIVCLWRNERFYWMIFRSFILYLMNEANYHAALREVFFCRLLYTSIVNFESFLIRTNPSSLPQKQWRRAVSKGGCIIEHDVFRPNKLQKIKRWISAGWSCICLNTLEQD